MVKVIENFITEEESAEILSHVNTYNHSKGVGRNSIKRYGSMIPYNSNIASRNLPDWSDFLIRKLADLNIKCNSITINEYHKGQGIGPHVDSKTSGDVISVLSLVGDAIMELTFGKESKLIALPARSLLIMTEEERWKWKHSIQPVKSARFSIVFRYGQ